MLLAGALPAGLAVPSRVPVSVRGARARPAAARLAASGGETAPVKRGACHRPALRVAARRLSLSPAPASAPVPLSALAQGDYEQEARAWAAHAVAMRARRLCTRLPSQL